MADPDMASTPFGNAGAPGNAGIASASTAKHDAARDAAPRVWVLDDARGGGDDACLAIAERLGVEFRRISLSWSARGAWARLSRHGSLAGLLSPLPLSSGLPTLTLSSGPRTAPVAAWLKHACGSRMVHYGTAGLPQGAADLLVRDAAPSMRPFASRSGIVLPVLGRPHRLWALGVRTERAAWRERLDHLPRPLLAVLLGGGAFGAEMRPADAYQLAKDLSGAVTGVQGAILASAAATAGGEATDAFASGLAGCMHLLYRAGEPGPDATIGFLASADAIVVAGSAPSRLLQACALPAPVYVSRNGVVGLKQLALEQRLCAAGHVRLLDGQIGYWRRTPLDEAGRVADVIRERLM